MEPLTLKAITYNIHKGFSTGNLRFVLPQIRDSLESTKADIVFLQEIQGEHLGKQRKIEAWPEEPQLEFLATNMWPHHVYGKNAIYDAGHHGNAIISRFPLIFWENINVSHSPKASRSLLHGGLQISETETLHVICIHLGLLASEREGQLIRLCQRIQTHVPPEEPLLIAGDFNDWRGRAEYHMEYDLGLHEIFKVWQGSHARTFPSWFPTLTVDRMYYRGLKLKHCIRIDTPPWKKLSDHIPLFAEFVFNRC
ncbi:endonuclease/exonuclease/phosphatase family protein [Deltaproteobacteria bacterium TL4]